MSERDRISGRDEDRRLERIRRSEKGCEGEPTTHPSRTNHTGNSPRNTHRRGFRYLGTLRGLLGLGALTIRHRSEEQYSVKNVQTSVLPGFKICGQTSRHRLDLGRAVTHKRANLVLVYVFLRISLLRFGV